MRVYPAAGYNPAFPSQGTICQELPLPTINTGSHRASSLAFTPDAGRPERQWFGACLQLHSRQGAPHHTAKEKDFVLTLGKCRHSPPKVLGSGRLFVMVWSVLLCPSEGGWGFGKRGDLVPCLLRGSQPPIGLLGGFVRWSPLLSLF